MENTTSRTVLAGDIGGTKTLLQLARFEGDSAAPAEILKEQRFDSSAYSRLTAMVRDFVGGRELPALHGACFGVAGPVQREAGREWADLTNLPWAVDAGQIREELGLERVGLVNDFEAVGIGIEALGPEDLAVLQEGAPDPDAPRAVLGAGTGLGVALVVPGAGGRRRVFATEGGHVDLAPNSAEQSGLLEHLRKEYDHVSYERVVSGPGLENIYRYQLNKTGCPVEEDPLLVTDDPAAAISEHALAGDDALASRSLDLFVQLYGAMAGNLALTTLARGGVYVGGGIAPRILERLQRGDFIEHFCAKGRMSHLLEATPVKVITNARVGLLGAALAASRL